MILSPRKLWVIVLAALAAFEIYSVRTELITIYSSGGTQPEGLPAKKTQEAKPRGSLDSLARALKLGRWKKKRNGDDDGNEQQKKQTRTEWLLEGGGAGTIFVAFFAADALVRSCRSAASAAARRDDALFRRTVLSFADQPVPGPAAPWCAGGATLLFFLGLLPASVLLLLRLIEGGCDGLHRWSVAGYVFSGFRVSSGAYMKAHLVRITKNISRRVALAAVTHPLWSRQRLKVILRTVRWVKYGAPVVGTANKLLGNSKDLFKKRRQAHEARIARRLRRSRMSDMTQTEREIYVATKLQAIFRRRRLRKAMRVFASKEETAALLIQRTYRRRTAQRKASLMKTDQLYGVLMEAWRANDRRMADTERTEERKRVAASIALGRDDPPLLMRPNTRFAVTWKLLFVVCILLELTSVAFSHRFGGGEAGKKMSVDELLKAGVVPGRDGDVCGERRPGPFGHVGRAFGALLPPGEKVAAAAHGACPAPAASLYVLTALAVISYVIVPAVHLICFLDVPVTFLTGELDDRTGVLIPKPFFPRWILPGIALQLLVNPSMANVAGALGSVKGVVDQFGGARLLRWGYCLAAPVAQLIGAQVDRIRKL